MGIIRDEDVIAWDVNGLIYCPEHFEHNPENGEPITEDALGDDVITVVCDKCGKKIY